MSTNYCVDPRLTTHVFISQTRKAVPITTIIRDAAKRGAPANNLVHVAAANGYTALGPTREAAREELAKLTNITNVLVNYSEMLLP